MKPTAVLLTVILLATGLFSCITKDKPNTYIPDDVLREIPLKKADTMAVQQPDHKEDITQRTVRLKPVKPRIGTITYEGEPSHCGVLPPPPAEDYNDTMIWRKVEIEAEYPGGAAAWQRFLNRNLRYPQEAIDNEIQGSAVVQFVVDKEGNVSDVEAVSGPQVLCAEMIRVIKKSGKWTPAVQGGRQVKSLKKQPICIHLEAEE